MENFSASHINDLIGNSGKKYTADKFVRYPFNGDFSIKNCICIWAHLVSFAMWTNTESTKKRCC